MKYSLAFLSPILIFLSCCGVDYSCCCLTGSSSSYGKASWYGKEFHGKRTASGEIFNMYAFTAAHRTLPFGTKVRVTNLANGKSVVVKINDRGPFVRGRIIDLSYAAAKKIGLVRMGVAKVKIEVLGRY
ncbi:hypothetical protein DRP53_01395 [candidate division WOR-3 bacterium]|uniref:Probable endolytic peptidoglycan transglycosylase RlpA n=1 Tax=candidate division WOR-3 bacterium TaxID=2052148 RepID=A0A660SNA9_UNCW3|nr:MAG: hypothetical protein DRP53_01395 [candidate division WOR-3 bacterium]